MVVFTFHLAKSDLRTTMQSFVRPPTVESVPGLVHAECMTAMKLGSPVLSPERIRPDRLAIFARWENEAAIEQFLGSGGLGRTMAAGWHVRLELLRRFGLVREFDDLPEAVGHHEPSEPVIAITLARLKRSQLARFIRWGKPAEELIQQHPGTTFALAAARPFRTVSTFSVWRTADEMIDMVHGHSPVPDPKRHVDAMAERERKDFHFEFTALRFRPLSEHGEWEGRSNIVPLGPSMSS